MTVFFFFCYIVIFVVVIICGYKKQSRESIKNENIKIIIYFRIGIYYKNIHFILNIYVALISYEKVKLYKISNYYSYNVFDNKV